MRSRYVMGVTLILLALCLTLVACSNYPFAIPFQLSSSASRLKSKLSTAPPKPNPRSTPQYPPMPEKSATLHIW